MTEDLNLDIEETMKSFPKEEVEEVMKTINDEDIKAIIEKEKGKKATKEDIQDIKESLARAELMKKEQEKREWTQCSMLYQEEIDIYQEQKETLFSEEQFKEYKESVLQEIKKLEDYEGEYSYMTKEEIFISGLCVAFQDSEITSEGLFERWNWYKEAKNFFEKENAFDILEVYHGIIKTDDEGFYRLEDSQIMRLLNENGIHIDSEEDRKKIKDIILQLWDNQKEMIFPNTLNEYSKEKNGIDFKYFLFCEEYIRRGRIKPTCEYLGIGRTTAYDYLKKEEVKNYLQQRREEITKESDEIIQKGMKDCFVALLEMGTKDSYVDNQTRVKSLDCYLKHYTNIIKKKDFEGEEVE